MANFWTNTKIEPKRSYRWLGFINLFSGTDTSADFGPSPFLISSFTQPVFELPHEATLNNFTSEQNIIVRNYQWADGTVIFIDGEGDDINATSKLYDWFTSLGYQPDQSSENLSKLFSNLATQKLQLKLSKINPKGEIFETWTFLNVVPTNVNYGDLLDYSTDSFSSVTMNFAYTAAKYEKGLGET